METTGTKRGPGDAARAAGAKTNPDAKADRARRHRGAAAPGRFIGAVMARMNRDMEEAAVAELDPDGDDPVLAVGFGAGVGVALLAARPGSGPVAGIDPSASMIAQAARRNRGALRAGRVHLVQARAESIPWPDASFAGVLAVNSLQLWAPLATSVREVVRVLAPGGSLVTVTHVWAIEKRSSVADWAAAVSALLGAGGMAEVTKRTAPFRSGPGLVLRARKPLDRNPIAP